MRWAHWAIFLLGIAGTASLFLYQSFDNACLYSLCPPLLFTIAQTCGCLLVALGFLDLFDLLGKSS